MSGTVPWLRIRQTARLRLPHVVTVTVTVLRGRGRRRAMGCVAPRASGGSHCLAARCCLALPPADGAVGTSTAHPSGL